MEHSIVDCGLLIQGTRILVAKRKDDAKYFPSMWEIPGGKRNEGEDAQSCVEREMMEEVSALVSVGDLLATVELEWPEDNKSATINLYQCVIYSNPHLLAPNCSSEIKWVDVTLLNLLDPVTPSCKTFFEAAIKQVEATDKAWRWPHIG